MSKKAQNSRKSHNEQPIRNLTGFMKAYLKSESAKRSLERQQQYVDRTTEDSRGNKVHYREATGKSNQLALALQAAFS